MLRLGLRTNELLSKQLQFKHILLPYKVCITRRSFYDLCRIAYLEAILSNYLKMFKSKISLMT